MPKNRDGEVITWKEFGKRWKDGIANLTPTQRLLNDSRATIITLVGFVVAIIALIIYRDKFVVSWFTYGLILIFVGNIYSTTLKLLGIRQQLRFFKTNEVFSVNLDEALDKFEELTERGEEKLWLTKMKTAHMFFL